MNEEVFRLLNEFAGASVLTDTLFIFCGAYLGWVLIVGIGMFLFRERWSHPRILFFPKREHAREVGIVFFTALVVWLATQVLKDIFDVSRPFLVLDKVRVLLGADGTGSFPSGHASFFGALAFGLYFYHRRLAYFYGGAAVLIGVSRIVAGVHWPLDVVGGYMFGILVAYIIYVIVRKTGT